MPMEEQDAAVAQALERAAGQEAQAHLDQMRQALERCFDAIGSSERYRNLYFQPLNEIYALAHYFNLGRAGTGTDYEACGAGGRGRVYA